jgi:hypothetical protein
MKTSKVVAYSIKNQLSKSTRNIEGENSLISIITSDHIGEKLRQSFNRLLPHCRKIEPIKGNDLIK